MPPKPPPRNRSGNRVGSRPAQTAAGFERNWKSAAGAKKPGAKKPGGGRGGPRTGAGRPGRRKVTSINWKAVARHARAGTGEDDIITVLQIPAELLQIRENAERLKREVELGNAAYRTELRLAVRQRALAKGEAGSVNTLQTAARNELGWDQPMAQTTETEPDVDEGLLLELLRKLAARGGPEKPA